MLEMLENTDVKVINNPDENSQTSLYTIFNNKISIANTKGSHARIQTVAHECMHSTQSKRLLWSNFIISNICIIYFVIISILTIFRIVENTSICMYILIFILVIKYIIRSFLEIDAMTKSTYLARKYLESTNEFSEDELIKLISSYKEINKIGIPIINFALVISTLLKIIIYSIISLIMYLI